MEVTLKEWVRLLWGKNPQTIQAIKILREAVPNLGLKQSKEACLAFAEQKPLWMMATLVHCRVCDKMVGYASGWPKPRIHYCSACRPKWELEDQHESPSV